MARIAVGIDTGKRRHQAAAYDIDGASWVGQLGFSVSRTGFEQALVFLASLAAQATDVVVGLEATGHYHLTHGCSPGTSRSSHVAWMPSPMAGSSRCGS